MIDKKIETILAPPPPHMVGDGFRVHNFFPGGSSIGQKRMSPFFMLDYNSKMMLPPSKTQKGVGVHPHRGFETVTISFHGQISHHDSSGNSGIIREGDVQWMTAGSGILHKEYHAKEFSEKGGLFQMVQLWVNLPSVHKMSKPSYQAITGSEMGKYLIEDEGGVVNVIAGDFKGTKGPAKSFSPIHMYSIQLNKGRHITFTLPENYNTGILIIEGVVMLNKHLVKQDQFVLFKNEGESITIESNENSVVLILSGEPINEPIAAYGPFLMNTQQELVQAVEDYNMGKFGFLED